MSEQYKAIQYKVKVHHDDVVDQDEPWNNRTAYDTYEIRYCIVDSTTGEVIDDAQGYGYKTAQKAYAAFYYKNKDKSKDKKKKHIKQFEATLQAQTITRSDALDAFYSARQQMSYEPEMSLDEINAEINAARADSKM